MILDWEPLNGRTGHEAGRELLARLYRRETGEELPPILKTPRGKPFFETGGWYFSTMVSGMPISVSVHVPIPVIVQVVPSAFTS